MFWNVLKFESIKKNHSEYNFWINFFTVWIFQIGQWDLRRVVISGQQEKYTRFTIYLFERVAARVRELNAQSAAKNITEYILLTDLAGFNLRQHGCLRCKYSGYVIEIYFCCVKHNSFKICFRFSAEYPIWVDCWAVISRSYLQIISS